MAMTTDTRPTETTPQPATPIDQTTGLGGLFVWAAVAIALVAATVLGIRAFRADDPAAPQPWYSVEHGSIAALDHAVEVEAAQPFSVEHGSVAAIDHAASAPAGVAEASADHGSIAANDHAATNPSAAPSWYSEQGSVTALDHDAAAGETEAG